MQQSHFLSRYALDEINITIISDGCIKESASHNSLRGYFSSQIISVPAYRRVIRSLDIYSVDDSFFQEKSHDRFFICDLHFCYIGAGFQLFRSFPISTTACSLSTLRESSLRSVIQKAKRLAEWKESVL